MTTWRIFTWTAVPVTAIAIGAGALVASAAPNAEPAERPAIVLVEDTTCATPASPATPATPEPAAGSVTIQVTIPPVAWLEVDETGRLIAAATNTGCAPRTGDEVFVRRPDSTLVEVTVDLDAIAWVGDFTQPAVLAPQTDPVVIGR